MPQTDTYNNKSNVNNTIPDNAGKIHEYKRGDGHVSVQNSRTRNGKVDIINFNDIVLGEIGFRREKVRDYDDLIIECGNGDSIRMKGFFEDQANLFDEFHFKGGGVLTLEDIYRIYNYLPENYYTTKSPFSSDQENLANKLQYTETILTTFTEDNSKSQPLPMEHSELKPHIAIANRELNLLLNTIAVFDSISNNNESLITSEPALTQPLITTSSY